MAITYTTGGTASNIAFVPVDDEGNAAAVEGQPVVTLSAELEGLVTWEPDASGFAGRLVAAADLGNRPVAGTFNLEADADLGPDVSTIFGVLEVRINPPAARATMFTITASDPA